MSFDEIPENLHEGYTCDCGGSVTQSHDDGNWYCDSCDFVGIDPENQQDINHPG